MARMLVVAALMLAAGSTASVASPSAASTATAAPTAAARSLCAAPITFICSNDPGNGLAGPAVGPFGALIGGSNGNDEQQQGGEEGEGIVAIVSNSVWDVVSSVSTWLMGGDPNAAAADAAGRPLLRGALGDANSRNGASAVRADKKLSFYEAADAGSECHAISGALAATTDATLPDPNTMTKAQSDASYFHVMCGDIASFHVRAEQYTTNVLSSGMGRTFVDDGVKPVLAKGESAEAKGFFPKRFVSKKDSSTNKGIAADGAPFVVNDKLRSTALIIVPGGSYERLSFYESMVFPMEIINGQLRREEKSAEETAAAAAAVAAAKDHLAGKATEAESTGYLPIVLQYRLTPPTPEAPMEDISKVVRMLERYRQKRLVASLVVGGGGADGNEAKEAKKEADGGAEPSATTATESDTHDDHIGDSNDAEQNYPPRSPFDFADPDGLEIGLSKEEREQLLRERNGEGGAADGKAQTRLSPAMLGLTDDFKIVIVGFSAGGHAAATYASLASTISSVSASVLVFPVISMENATIAHYKSTLNLLNVEPNATAVSLLPEAALPAEEEAAVAKKEKAAAAEAVPPPPAAIAAGGAAAAAVENRRGFSALNEGYPADAAAPVDGAAAVADALNNAAPSSDEDEQRRRREAAAAAANERLAYQRGLQNRYTPSNFPANFPQCVYLTHAATDPTVAIDHSQLMFDSLVQHRRAAIVRRQTVAKIRERRKREARELRENVARGQANVVVGGAVPANNYAGVQQQARGFSAAAELSSSSSSTSSVVNAKGAAAGAFAEELRDLILPPMVFDMPANASDPKSRSTGTLQTSFGVGLRSYPKGPHGRWFLTRDTETPELADWWTEAHAFLESNGCV